MSRLAVLSAARWIPLVAVVSVLRLSSCLAFGQLVEIGPGNPHACEEVRVQPNLILSRPIPVEGHVEDQSGAAVANTRLELRTYKSALEQTLLKRAQTNAKGDFSLGEIPAGRYRLLVFIPGFKQATTLTCSRGDNCALSIRLQVAPTDTFPESVCPPR